jgi:hypothetical protein
MLGDVTEMTDVVAVVERLEQSALADLAAATGDTSLCALARSGRSHPAAKFHEGAARALADVRRGLRRADGGGVGAVSAQVRKRWLADQEAMASRGRDWAAYYAGGLDALDWLADDLDGTSRG